MSKEVHTDPKTDLATVTFDPKGASLPFLEFGDSDLMEIGDRVLAVGAPFGLTGSVTHGIISAKGRNMNMNFYEDFLQTDAPINPGNSGGPLVNLEGKVIGINSAIKSRSGGFQGVGLAISSNLAKNVMDQLLKDGVVRRGYLGVQIKDLDADVAARLGLKDGDGGVVVAQVFEKAPAAKGGVEAGDVIVAVAGKPVTNGRDLQRLVAGLPLNKPVEITVWREGQKKPLQVTIEEQPGDFGSARVPAPIERRRERGNAPVSLDKLGVEVTDLNAELAGDLGYKESVRGVVVTSVEADSVGEAAGLRRGTMIVKVEKTPVATAQVLKDALDQAALDKGVLLQVQSPAAGLSYVVIKAETSAAQK
jgi:serine protease Do